MVCIIVLLCWCMPVIAAPLQQIELKQSISLNIIDKPIAWSNTRERLIQDYSKLHYGQVMNSIVPQVVIIHWTVFDKAEPVYRYFYPESMSNGTLNVASHFLVDRDGTIFRLTSETALNRHAIGYNWCAIGIENVGGKDGIEDLTAAQLQANIELIRYLKQKYNTIQYVWGHYQQGQAKQSGLFIENVKGYYSSKIDPGPVFMHGLREALRDTGLKFYTE